MLPAKIQATPFITPVWLTTTHIAQSPVNDIVAARVIANRHHSIPDVAIPSRVKTNRPTHANLLVKAARAIRVDSLSWRPARIAPTDAITPCDVHQFYSRAQRIATAGRCYRAVTGRYPNQRHIGQQGKKMAVGGALTRGVGIEMTPKRYRNDTKSHTPEGERGGRAGSRKDGGVGHGGEWHSGHD